jgi:hypothetical protein
MEVDEQTLWVRVVREWDEALLAESGGEVIWSAEWRGGVVW